MKKLSTYDLFLLMQYKIASKSICHGIHSLVRQIIEILTQKQNLKLYLFIYNKKDSCKQSRTTYGKHAKLTSKGPLTYKFVMPNEAIALTGSMVIAKIFLLPRTMTENILDICDMGLVLEYSRIRWTV